MNLLVPVLGVVKGCGTPFGVETGSLSSHRLGDPKIDGYQSCLGLHRGTENGFELVVVLSVDDAR